uniref:Bulb-type lectin domain-containing protein n=1 Tax=Glycine max TaxID=3847 RepID=A0A0R0JVL9_SOYBN
MSSTLDMVTPTHPIRDGFFNLANSNNRYLGVWYKNIFPRTTVWVANKETPLKDNTGILEVGTNQGILSIKDGGGAKIWSSSASHTPNKSIVVKLLESGNMVMKDGHNNLLWQSFDYPSDTLLPGMKIGVNFKTGQHRALRSWKSLSDLTLVIIKENANSSNDIAYRQGSWNGLSVTELPGEINDQLTKSLFVMNENDVFYEILLLNSSTILRRNLLPEKGYQVRFIWLNKNKRWVGQLPKPYDVCQTYSLCGANTICNFNGKDKHCECLNCNKGDIDKFQKYDGMKLSDTSSSWYDKTISLQECEKYTLSNCSCTAYAQLNISGNGSGCLHWFYDIVDIRTLPMGGQDFYLRMAIVSNLDLQLQDKSKKDDIDLPIFHFLTISNATNHFSKSNNLGQGGFGPMYKQDEKLLVYEFMPNRSLCESCRQTLANLLRVHPGTSICIIHSKEEKSFCLSQKVSCNQETICLLNYSTRRTLLDWAKRFEIICGIA